MPGYTYNDPGNTYFIIESFWTGDFRIRWSDGVDHTERILRNEADGVRRYRQWTLGTNDNGSPTTNQGNNESQSKYKYYQKIHKNDIIN